MKKNRVTDNDLFCCPVDVSDHTVPNGNSVMLINLVRLGFKKEANELAISLNGYINIYKSFMVSSIKAIDFVNMTSSGKQCNEKGCKI